MPLCFSACVWVLITLLIGAIGSTAAASEDITAELRRLTQENLDAIAPGSAQVWRRNAHEDLIHGDEQGVVRNKAELLSEFQPLPQGLVGRLEIDKFHLIRKGDTAVATHKDPEAEDAFFAPGRPRTRRIFQRGPNGEITGFVDRREGHDIRWTRVN